MDIIANGVNGHIEVGRAAQRSAIATTASVSLGLATGVASAGIGGFVAGSFTKYVLANGTQILGREVIRQGANLAISSTTAGLSNSLMTWSGETILNHTLFGGEKVLQTDIRRSFIEGFAAIPSAKFAQNSSMMSNKFARTASEGIMDVLTGTATEIAVNLSLGETDFTTDEWIKETLTNAIVFLQPVAQQILAFPD